MQVRSGLVESSGIILNRNGRDYK
uniref:Endoplasmic reticulum-Golgi intermediate compartment protein 3-like n=1 Tax=Rhizophora mucronata TaxID=61149 RepID=A0A2P2M8F3_RHIMU